MAEPSYFEIPIIDSNNKSDSRSRPSKKSKSSCDLKMNKRDQKKYNKQKSLSSSNEGSKQRS